MGAGNDRVVWPRRSGPIAALLVAAVGFIPSSANAATNRSCADRQSVAVDKHAEWRCELALRPEQAYLVRADQRNLDVMVEVVAPDASRAIAVDAPAKRTTRELALLGPTLSGKYTVEVRSVDGERSRGQVDVAVESIIAAPDAPLLRGLRELTHSAAPNENESSDAAKRRIMQLRRAATALREAGARDLEAETHLRMAAVYYWTLLDWSQAASSAGTAMDAFRQLQDPVMHSQAAVLRSAALIEIASAVEHHSRRSGAQPERSTFDEVMELLTAAARAFRQAGQAYDEAQAVNYHGIALYYQGDYEAARAKYLEAARIYEVLGDGASRALPLQNIANIDFDRGDYARAVDSYGRLLGVLRASNDRSRYINVLLNRGMAQSVLGDFDQALLSYLTALQLSGEHRLALEEARSLQGLGLVYLAIGERERAAAFLERALVLWRSLAEQDPRGLQNNLLRVGDLKRSSGDVRGALSLHVEALDLALTLPDKAAAFYAIGRDQEANEALPAATQAYETALALDLPRELRVRVKIMGAYGNARILAGDPSGRSAILAAARLHESHGDVDLAAQDYLNLALDDRRASRVESALTNVQRALTLYESQRLRTINPDLRATYLASRSAAFELQGDLYMRLSERAQDAKQKKRFEHLALLANEANRQRVLDDFRGLAHPAVGVEDVFALDAQIAAKRHRLAVIMDQPDPAPEKIETLRRNINLLRTRLDVAQARRGMKDGAAAAHTPAAKPTAIQAIQATLAPDAALLVYQLGDTRSWLWCVTSNSTSAFRLSERAVVEQAARELYSLWSTPNSSPSGSTRELVASRTILGPATFALRGKRTIAVVADGVLRSLPFGALWMDSASAGKPLRLAETHAVTFRPTLSPATAGTPATANAGATNRILLVGDPTIPNAPKPSSLELLSDPWSWQPLPGARQEIRAIADIAADWRSYVLLGAEASKPALLSMPLDTFRAIHFATHARLDVQDPQLSSIALSSRDASFGAPGSTLTVREIVGFKLQAETVVLSACEASLGKQYRGQLSFGLSEAFLLAGARNVLGSLWRVSDDTAQAYMRRFYDEYVRHDATPVAAAQAAARALSRDPDFSHPYYWAAFVVTQR